MGICVAKKVTENNASLDRQLYLTTGISDLTEPLMH